MVQDSLTSITVSWTPSTNATGYRIYYDNSGGHSGFEDVGGGSTDNHTLSDLQNGTTYTISIMATSYSPPSTLVELNIDLSNTFAFLKVSMFILVVFFLVTSPPGQIVLTVTSIPTISLSWRVAAGGPVDSWEVMWREVDTNETDSTYSGSLSSTNYTVINLKTTTLYSVRVRGINALGSADSPRIIFFTCDCSSVTPTYPANVTALVILGAGAAMLTLMLLVSVVVNIVLILKSRNKANLSTSDRTRQVYILPAAPYYY